MSGFYPHIPALQHDLTRPEDIDTEGEDHAGDECRYACMSRPWIQDDTLPLKDIIAEICRPRTLNEMIDLYETERLDREDYEEEAA